MISSASPTALRSKILWSVVGWLVVLVFLFPVLWMWLEGFKTEPQAASSPPMIFFVPTLEEFQQVLSGDFPPFFINSAIASIGSTLLVLILGLPAAYALAIRPVKRTQDVLFFFISTRFLPFAASLVSPVAGSIPLRLPNRRSGVLLPPPAKRSRGLSVPPWSTKSVCSLVKT